MSLLPRIDPLHRSLAPRKSPSCDAIIRSTHDYSLFLNTLLRSLEIFWPHDMGKIIVILSDSDEDRSYALTLPDYVTVFFEGLPPFFDLWAKTSFNKRRSLAASHRYHRAQWSNFISDRYSSADFLTIFDADQVISGGGQLQLLFDWDYKLQKYKPIFTCFDNIDIFIYNMFTLSYKIFGMSKIIGIECMKSLPVVIYRDTLPKTRNYLVNYFLMNNPGIYNDTRLQYVSIDYDNNQNWRWFGKNETSNYSMPSSVTYFDRAFAFLSENCRICQYCIFGAFIYTHPEESSKYTFKIIGYKKSAEKLKQEQIQLIHQARIIDNYRRRTKGMQKNYSDDNLIYRPECTQIHSGAHIAYMINGQKMSEEYFRLAETIIDDGLCKASRPEDCNYKYCKSRGWNYDAIQHRKLNSHLVTNVSFPLQFFSNQQALLGWERYIPAPGGLPSCRSINYALLHHYFEWQQRFESKNYDQFKLRQCTRQ